MSEAYVFIGPTLSVAEAYAELNAVYLPPVAAGDIFRLWRTRPRAIGIVDGYFEHVPAVWHKEIMWIMEQGVHVFGSAGMGALRAAELDSFGMRGVGQVYQAVKDGTLDRDDEVAVACEAGPQGCQALSEAMVNIRATLNAARKAEVISDATCGVLTTAAAALFYQQRTWPAVLEAGGAQGIGPAKIRTLREWLPAGKINQQADDAVAMLRQMRALLAAAPSPLQVRWTMARTTRWQAAMRQAVADSDEPGNDQ